MKHRKALILLLIIGLTVSSAGFAQAALITKTWGAWTLFNQEKSNWCWAAAAKMLIHKTHGSSPSQCDIARNGKKATSCANSSGTLNQLAAGMKWAGVKATVVTSKDHPTYTELRNLTVAGRGVAQAIKFPNQSVGHIAPLIGTHADTSKIYVVNITVRDVTGSWVTLNDFRDGKSGLNSRYSPVGGYVTN